MGVLLHSVHIALLVAGGVGVAFLLRPSQPRHAHAIRQLRVAVANGTLVELAHERARTELAGEPTRPTPARLLYAVSFAVISVSVGVVANRLSGGVAPLWGSVAILLVGLVAAGTWLFARPRRTRQVAGLAIVAQVVVHAGLVVSLIYQAHRAGLRANESLADLLFCHRAGFTATAGQLASARAGLDLGPASPQSTGFISLGAALVLVASLAVAALATGWLNRDGTPAQGRTSRAGEPSTRSTAISMATRAGFTRGWR